MIITYDQEFWLSNPDKWVKIIPKLTGVEWCFPIKDLTTVEIVNLITYTNTCGLAHYFHFPHHLETENMSCLLKDIKSPIASDIYLNYIDQVYKLLPDSNINFVMHPLVSNLVSPDKLLLATCERYDILMRHIQENYKGSIILETTAEYPWTLDLYKQFSASSTYLKRQICLDTVHAKKLGDFSQWSALYDTINYIHLHNNGPQGPHCGISYLSEDLKELLVYFATRKTPVNLELLVRYCRSYEVEVNATLDLIKPLFND
jgi:hypothetical protein